MKKFGKLAAFVCALSFAGMAAASANPVDSDNAIGISFLGTTETAMYGLQYQHWFTDKIGMQVEGSAYYNPDNNFYSGYVLNYDICAEFQYKLYETSLGERSATNLYAWLLAGHHAYIKRTSEYEAVTGTSTTTSSGYCPNAVCGLGFGFDIMFLNHISLPIEFGFLSEFPNDPSIDFAFGSGIRYRF